MRRGAKRQIRTTRAISSNVGTGLCKENAVAQGASAALLTSIALKMRQPLVRAPPALQVALTPAKHPDPAALRGPEKAPLRPPEGQATISLTTISDQTGADARSVLFPEKSSVFPCVLRIAVTNAPDPDIACEPAFLRLNHS